MDAKQYFEENKDKIRETAEFLCKDGSCKVDEKFEELKNQYYNEDGTHHNETITINGQFLPITDWLERIRHEQVENFMIVAVFNGKSNIIYKNVGNQFSVHNINLNDIDRPIVSLITFGGVKTLGIYVVHNHPYIYRANPSDADYQTLEGIYNELNSIKINAKEIGKSCDITLIDFSIVTEFDYWSSRQS